MKEINHSETEPIFIIGVGRSGTSLLQSMLNSHSEISFIPETHFLRKYVFTGNKTISSKSVPDFTQELNADKDYVRAKIKPEEIIKVGNNCLATYNLLLEKYLTTKKKTLIGDKNPRNIDFIPQLKRFFPKSKVIHIIRDPRDVVLSRTKADWSKHWPFNLHAYMYNTQILRGMRLGKKLFDKNYLEVYYENLIENPEIELEKISSFLGVSFEKNMLDFGSSAKELVDKSEMQWKKETFGPLLTSNKNKWKKEFKSSQIDLIQQVCSSAFENFPYEKEKIESTYFQNKIHLMGSKIFRLLYPLRIQFLKK